ncbi:hypothetical protein SAMN05216337_101796 [Bradyrhizobium brasilense]|uniref:Uncharacterized protein n=1 Tax=Bradyrhizobium brasilense TaxID=1419277 RepID=A0A1G6YUD6_9BRAD|nr:hypothetical protein [Bradyrhizobium brasilense]SDD93892.1 hypothetical protein SAMN05216337_101796 [Bradyrhizobium brasilense]
MKQSRFMSALETTLSTATGFFLSLFLQWLVLPLLVGVPIPLHTNLAFASIMTVASLLRGFVMRRVFEALHIRRPLSPFMLAAIAERYRQIEQEGWTVDHDDDHSEGQLAAAGGAYAMYAGCNLPVAPHEWPWAARWWKQAGFRRDLVKAAALIIAEGEKFDRNRKRGGADART